MKQDLEALRAGAGEVGVVLDDDALARLAAFESLLAERAIPLGLVAEGDRPRLRERHVLDCLRAAAVVDPDDRSAYDLGSGAGLPGLVVAIACPALEVGLIEVRAKRAAFLELAIERLALPNATVLNVPAGEVTERRDLCLARAFAPPAEAWAAAQRLLVPGGRLILFAGASEAVEVAGATVRLVPAPGGPLAGAGPLAIMVAS